MPQDLLPRERRALAVAVREIRARRGMTQEEVSAAAGLGRGYCTDLETGRRRASFDAVVMIARALDVSMVELMELYEDRLGDQAR